MLHESPDLAIEAQPVLHSDATDPITDLIVVKEAEIGDIPADYVLIQRSLSGVNSTTGKAQYLAFKRDPDGQPITDMWVAFTDSKIGKPEPPCPKGFEKIPVNVNPGSGRDVYISIRREAGAAAIINLAVRYRAKARDKMLPGHVEIQKNLNRGKTCKCMTTVVFLTRHPAYSEYVVLTMER